MIRADPTMACSVSRKRTTGSAAAGGTVPQSLGRRAKEADDRRLRSVEAVPGPPVLIHAEPSRGGVVLTFDDALRKALRAAARPMPCDST